jgi:putative intracellular protease/amidase
LIIEENDDKRENSAELLELHHFGVLTQKPVAFVCHMAAALIKVKAENDYPFVKEKRIIGFSNTEEERTD